jgi:hypothetical protein
MISCQDYCKKKNLINLLKVEQENWKKNPENFTSITIKNLIFSIEFDGNLILLRKFELLARSFSLNFLPAKLDLNVRQFSNRNLKFDTFS